MKHIYANISEQKPYFDESYGDSDEWELEYIEWEAVFQIQIFVFKWGKKIMEGKELKYKYN